MSYDGDTANSTAEGSASQGIGGQQRQLLELTTKFRALVNEAKSVGENTPRGKELLIKASKIKAIYDNYNRQRQQAAQAFVQGRNGGTPGANPASSGSTGSVGAVNAAGSSSSGSSQQSRSSGSQLANIIKQVLTPEQNQQFEALSQNFQARANSIRDKHTFLKQHIERLNQEVSKQTDASAKKQLEEKKTELANNLKMLNMEYGALQQEFQNGKKKFYVECARHNPALQRLLQRSTQQQRMAQQQQVQQVRQEITPRLSKVHQLISLHKSFRSKTRYVRSPLPRTQEVELNLKLQTSTQLLLWHITMEPINQPYSNSPIHSCLSRKR